MGELAGGVSMAAVVIVSDKWQITGDMYQVTHDTQHVTHDIWHMTCKMCIKKKLICLIVYWSICEENLWFLKLSIFGYNKFPNIGQYLIIWNWEEKMCNYTSLKIIIWDNCTNIIVYQSVFHTSMK